MTEVWKSVKAFFNDQVRVPAAGGWTRKGLEAGEAGNHMTRIAILGGSFNPPHNGHVGMAAYVLDHHLADEVWVLPCADHPYGKLLAPFSDRLAMCRLAFQDLARVTVSDIESTLPQPSYTVQTLRQIKKDELQLFLIVGSDVAADIPNWKDGAEIPTLATVVEIPRSPDSIVQNASATDIRGRVQRGAAITDQVPKLVAQYIQSHHLYR